MRFLHTADLHLGKALHEQSLLDDQRFLLERLTSELEAGSYDALVIAGDVYDRAIPAPEAITLMSTFLGDLRRRLPSLAILMTAGNHDSAERLGYAGELLTHLGIHIGYRPEEAFSPVVLESNGEATAFFLLPFLTPGSLANAKGEPLRSQSDLLAEAARRLETARTAALEAGAKRTVLLAHLFSLGGKESESERVFLGTAEKIDIGLFSGFDYVALGHLHRCQHIAGNAWYAGSPLAYSFGEAGERKHVLRVDTGEEGIQVSPIEVQPLRKLSRLSGSFHELHSASEHRPERESYLEIELTDDHLVENPLALLRSRYPWLLSIKQDRALLSLAGKREAIPSASLSGPRRGAVEDFEAFLGELYGSPDQTELALFQTMATEAEHETA